MLPAQVHRPLGPPVAWLPKCHALVAYPTGGPTTAEQAVADRSTGSSLRRRLLTATLLAGPLLLTCHQPAPLEYGILARISIPDGDPTSPARNADGSRVYVIARGLAQLKVIRTDVNTVVDSADAGDFPHGQCVLPDGQHLAVCDAHTDRLLTFRLPELTVVDSLTVDSFPVSCASSRDGRYLFVSCYYANRIDVVDIAESRVVARVPVGNLPWQIVPALDDRCFYAACRGDGQRGLLYVVRTSDFTVTDSVAVQVAAQGLRMSPDGSRLYVVCLYGGVDVVRVSDLELLARIRIDGVPVGADVAPDGRHLLVSCFQAGRLVLLRTDTWETVWQADGLPGVCGIEYQPDGRAYVAVRYNDEVLVVGEAGSALQLAR